MPGTCIIRHGKNTQTQYVDFGRSHSGCHKCRKEEGGAHWSQRVDSEQPFWRTSRALIFVSSAAILEASAAVGGAK